MNSGSNKTPKFDQALFILTGHLGTIWREKAPSRMIFSVGNDLCHVRISKAVYFEDRVWDHIEIAPVTDGQDVRTPENEIKWQSCGNRCGGSQAISKWFSGALTKALDEDRAVQS